jgi:hypothetical protein
VVSVAPATSIVVLSGLALGVGYMVVGASGFLVVFYLFGLPYYLVTLLAASISVDFGIRPGLWLPLLLVLGFDGILAVFRVAMRKGIESWRPIRRIPERR